MIIMTLMLALGRDVGGGAGSTNGTYHCENPLEQSATRVCVRAEGYGWDLARRASGRAKDRCEKGYWGL